MLVTCCLEEIWATEMKSNHAVGIALDDLNWATVTQFNRQYNASHPLVGQNIRRAYNTQPLSEKEFSDALPRYPNDGVLLIDVHNYNNMTPKKMCNMYSSTKELYPLRNIHR